MSDEWKELDALLEQGFGFGELLQLSLYELVVLRIEIGFRDDLL